MRSLVCIVVGCSVGGKQWKEVVLEYCWVLLRYEITSNAFLNYMVRCESVKGFTDKKKLPVANRSLKLNFSFNLKTAHKDGGSWVISILHLKHGV